jgi:hypothetical protein
MLILSTFLGFNVSSSMACKCMELSVEEAYKMADLIVLGNVTELEYGEDRNDISLQSITCFKGDCHKTEQFSTSSSSASCGFFSFTKDALEYGEDPIGGIFLVYATVDPDSKKKKLINSCGGTKEINNETVPVVLEIDSLYKLLWGTEVDDDSGSSD